MDSPPPSGTEVLALVIVGALSGAINALKRFSAKGVPQSILIGATEGIIALFVTIITYMILRSMEPEVFGWKLDTFGKIGISGAVAHLGLRQSIRFALRLAGEQEKKST